MKPTAIFHPQKEKKMKVVSFVFPVYVIMYLGLLLKCKNTLSVFRRVWWWWWLVFLEIDKR